jgi:outer membrane protein assembly factor BamB
VPRPLAAALLLAALAAPANAKPAELLYFPEGNRLRRIDVDTIDKGTLRSDVLIPGAGDESGGGDENLFFAPNRDANGMICAFPDGSGRFLMGEDTRQPHPPPGWGVFEHNGLQIGKLTPTYLSSFGEPYGCAFAADPDPGDDELPPLFTTDVGTEDIGGSDGQLLIWFPPYDAFPGTGYPETDERSTNYCKLASDIGTAGGVAIDDLGRVYVASASGVQILRFSPPFPTAPNAGGGCSGTDGTGAPVADAVNREVFASDDFYSGLAFGPNGHLYAAAVATGNIREYDLDGNQVRFIVDPPGPSFVYPTATGNPEGIAFGEDGTLYYADLDLVGTFPNDVETGDNGKIWRVRFNKKSEPLAPEIVQQGFDFPDAVAVFPGDLQRKKAGGKGKTEWRAYAGGPLRQFLNAKEKKLKPGTVPKLRERWRFPTNAIVTSSPSVAAVEVPDEGRVQVVYFTSWDWNVYAVRLSDGSKLWHFTADRQPGSNYPSASSPTIASIDGRETVFAAIGEILYAIDAVTGDEIWRFTAGTGCRDDLGDPPGLCAFDGERNQIESSPIVSGANVFFGMDVNEGITGKGGFFAVDAAAGTLAWYFDVETGSTCTPAPSDEVRAYDGYHSEAELGLAPGYLAATPGCDHDRAPTGCGNVWSSPAVDEGRGLLYFGVSNCTTDDDPMTPEPGPEMPDYDEALVALQLDGMPAWRWRPRKVDNDDRAFGATPNLFTIKRGKQKVDVVGIGGKDKHYYVIDRDGVNEETNEGFDPDDPLALPYWSYELSPNDGFVQGGVIGTPAVDEKARRVYLATAPGQNTFTPDQPTVHALDMDTGTRIWDFGTVAMPALASFAPVGATPALAMTGAVVQGQLRIFNAKTGEILARIPLESTGSASGPVVIDGTVLVGAEIGSHGEGADAEAAAGIPSNLFAFCVPKSKGCPKD